MSDTKKKETTNKEGMASYFKGVKSEWGKITWPERRQVVMETLVVLFVVFAFTTLVYVIDKVFQGLLGLIPNG